MSGYMNLLMLGQNIMNNETLPINEIFYSISGEGISSGLPTIFIRIAGCNFSTHPCNYCDTLYAIQKEDGELRTIDSIIEEISVYPCKRIIITGGEPLSHPRIHVLYNQLHARGYKTEIETNGSIRIDRSFQGMWSIDVKTPCSGNALYNNYGNIFLARPHDQIKFVIANRTDFEFTCNTLRSTDCRTSIILQPAWGRCNPEELAEWMKRDLPQARLGIQLHKIIWGDKKGK